jgi:hypothetical protein
MGLFPLRLSDQIIKAIWRIFHLFKWSFWYRIQLWEGRESTQYQKLNLHILQSYPRIRNAPLYIEHETKVPKGKADLQRRPTHPRNHTGNWIKSRQREIDHPQVDVHLRQTEQINSNMNFLLCFAFLIRYMR